MSCIRNLPEGKEEEEIGNSFLTRCFTFLSMTVQEKGRSSRGTTGLFVYPRYVGEKKAENSFSIIFEKILNIFSAVAGIEGRGR